MMADGNLDAVVVQTALPNPALRQLEATGGKVVLLPIPEDVVTKVAADHPYFMRFVIPKEMYDADEDLLTLNSTNMAIVDRNLSEDVVYTLTKTMLDNLDAIKNSHPAAKAFNLEAAAQVPIDLHPGAERYFKEKGIL
jgi:TRAP transporter TAXI family solute receptor